MTERQRTVAEHLATGKSQQATAALTGVPQASISDWMRLKPEFAAYVARLSQEVMEAAIRAAGHNIAEGVNELCAIRRKLANGLNVQSDAPIGIADAPAIREHRETVKALNDIAQSVQKNARDTEAHALSVRSERVALAAALAAAAANNIPTDPDEATK